MEQKNILTPEETWQKITALKTAIEDAEEKEYLEGSSYGTLSGAVSDKLMDFLKNISKEPNAEELYLCCLQKIDYSKDYTLDADDLQLVAAEVIDKPYAEKVLTAVMNHPKFRGLDDDLQISLLSKPALLEIYWQRGNDFSDEAELAICALPNWQQLLSKYFSYGHGLCANAQKKIFALPKNEAAKLLVAFFNGINEKNHSEHNLCQNGYFMLLKDRILFDLYKEKMAPFYKEKKQIFPATISFVAQRKGWL